MSLEKALQKTYLVGSIVGPLYTIATRSQSESKGLNLNKITSILLYGKSSFIPLKDSKKDLVLTYSDAVYAEQTNKILQSESIPLVEIIPVLEKFRKIVAKQGTENADQTKGILVVCQTVEKLKKLVWSVNSLCNKKLEVPSVDVKSLQSGAQTVMKNLIGEYGHEAKREFHRHVTSASSLGHILHLAHQHSTLLSIGQTENKDFLVQKLEENLKSAHDDSGIQSAGDENIRKIMFSMWREKSAKKTIEVAKALKSESLSRAGTEEYLKEQGHRNKLLQQWVESVEDELTDLIKV